MFILTAHWNETVTFKSSKAEGPQSKLTDKQKQKVRTWIVGKAPQLRLIGPRQRVCQRALAKNDARTKQTPRLWNPLEWNG